MFWIITAVVIFIGGIWFLAIVGIRDISYLSGILALLVAITGCLSKDIHPEGRDFIVTEANEYSIVDSPEELGFDKAYYNMFMGLYIEREKIESFEIAPTNKEAFVLKEVKKYKPTVFKLGTTKIYYTYFYHSEED